MVDRNRACGGPRPVTRRGLLAGALAAAGVSTAAGVPVPTAGRAVQAALDSLDLSPGGAGIVFVDGKADPALYHLMSKPFYRRTEAALRRGGLGSVRYGPARWMLFPPGYRGRSYTAARGGAVLASLDDIRADKPIRLQAYRDHSPDDVAVWEPVFGAPDLVLDGDRARAFLEWASHPSWRSEIERDLQGMAEGDDGRPLLSTWVPLPRFRGSFLADGLRDDRPHVAALAAELLAGTAGWAAAGADAVMVDGYETIPEREPRVVAGDT